MVCVTPTQPDPPPHRRASAGLAPGTWVRNSAQPGWGDGQVQSVVGHRVTVNFAHAGKVLVNTAVVTLEIIDADA